MSNKRLTKFGGRDISMSKMILSDCNLIMVPVLNAVSKFSMGESEVFSHFKVSDIEMIQKLLCKYVVWCEGEKNLSLFDLTEYIEEFAAICVEFLEFNFGVFTQGRKIIERLNGVISDRKETDKTETPSRI